MSNFSLLNLSDGWLEHLASRFKEGLEVGVVDTLCSLNLHTAVVMLPTVEKELLATIRPDMSVNEILGINARTNDVWVERRDFLSEATDEIVCRFGGGGVEYVVCEAGYSKAGDKSLSRFEHFVHKEAVFICAEISTATTESIESVLRGARSSRLLGAILSSEGRPVGMEGRKLAFLCDALDGDSLIFCNLKQL